MVVLTWLLCGLVAWTYFGIRTKWKGQKYNTREDKFREITICCLFGPLTLFVVVFGPY